MPRTKTTAPVLDPLDAMLTRLQLPGIRDQLDNLLDEAARNNLSARETLALLCEREIARKDHRRIDPPSDPGPSSSPTSQRPGISPASTTTPSPRSTPSRSAISPPAAGSPTARTCCCSARRASAKPTSPSPSGGKPSWPATPSSSSPP